MARKPVWIRWFPKDALDGMAQLAPMEELAYRRILDLIITTGDGLRDDDRALAWMTKAGRQWPAVKARLIELGKIASEDGFIRNTRASESCIETERFVAQKSGAGKSSAQRRKSLKSQKTGSTAVEPPVATSVATDASTEGQPSNIQQDSDSSLRSESAASPRPEATVLAEQSGGMGEESLGERVRRGQGGEARAILRILKPTLTEARMGQLLGVWTRDLGTKRAELIGILREAERLAASERIAGDPIDWIGGAVRRRIIEISGQGTAHEQRNRAPERRFYGGGGSDASRLGVLDAFPELAGGMETD